MREEPTRLFRVKVARPVFEIAIIDVEASDEDEAKDLALDTASQLPADAWTRSAFDADNYLCDVQDIIDSREADEEEWGPGAMEMKREPDRSVRYALLRADVESGTGDLLFPPWLLRESSLMWLDLGNDWIGDLDDIREKGRRAFFRHLRSQQPGAKDTTRSLPVLVRKTETDESDNVIRLERQRRDDSAKEKSHLLRQYAVRIEAWDDGVISFGFADAELGWHNIESIECDVRFIADALRDDAENFVGEHPCPDQKPAPEGTQSPPVALGGRRYETDVLVLVRARVPARSRIRSADLIMDLINVDETTLKQISEGHYHLCMIGGGNVDAKSLSELKRMASERLAQKAREAKGRTKRKSR